MDDCVAIFGRHLEPLSNMSVAKIPIKDRDILPMYLNYMVIMSGARQAKVVIMRVAQLFACSIGLAAATSGQATSNDIAIKAVAEVRTKTAPAGLETSKLTPATRVVPGDEVIYTLEVRNTGTTVVRAPVVTNPVPAHMAYIADSATGPGAEVTYSVDGGLTFDQPEDLRVVGEDGLMHRAIASDYTHIRWKLKTILKRNSVAFTRFRAVVK